MFRPGRAGWSQGWLFKHFCRHITAVRQTGVTAVGVVDDHHIALDDLFTQAFDALIKADVIAIVSSVASNEVLKHALKGRGIQKIVGYQHSVYFLDDMSADDTLRALSIMSSSR